SRICPFTRTPGRRSGRRRSRFPVPALGQLLRRSAAPPLEWAMAARGLSRQPRIVRPGRLRHSHARRLGFPPLAHHEGLPPPHPRRSGESQHFLRASGKAPGIRRVAAELMTIRLLAEHPAAPPQAYHMGSGRRERVCDNDAAEKTPALTGRTLPLWASY